MQATTIATNLALAIRKDRAKHNETLQAYSQRTGIDIAKLSRLENCRSPVTISLLLDISKRTNVKFTLTIK